MQHRLAEWWNRISLRTKITGVTVLLLILGLAVAGIGTMTVLRNYLLAEEDGRIIAAVSAISQQNLCQTTASPNDFYLGIVNHNGRLICDNRAEDKPRPVVSSLTLERVSLLDGAVTLPSTELAGQWRVVTRFISLDEDPDTYTAVVGLDLAYTNSIVNRYAAI